MKRSALVLWLLLPFVAHAAPSSLLTHQGRLFDAADRPVDGTVDFTFALYSGPSGGPALWSESHPAVAVQSGVYAVNLGAMTPIPSSVWAAQALHLSVSVGTSGELLPRLAVGTVPFAVVAATAADAVRLGGLTADDYLTRADAEETYAQRTELAAYLKIDDADATYVRPSDLSPYLKSADAESTFARTSDLSAYVRASTLAQVAFTGQLDGYLKTTDAASFYLSKAEASTGYLSKAEAVAYLTKTDAVASYLSKTEAASTYAPRGSDVRNVLDNGGFEGWTGLFQTQGFNGTTATTYLPQLPIGWTGVVAGNTNTPQGVDPSAAVGAYLTTGRVLSRQTDSPKEGSSYVRLTFPAVTRDAGIELKVPQLALEPNRTYTLAFWARVQAGTNTQNDLVVTAAGTQFVAGGSSTPLPTSWTLMGPYTFTTSSTVSGASLVIKPRGLGGTVDVDGVGIWRGTTIGDSADVRPACPGDMVGAGDFCIEPAVTQRGATWFNVNTSCRALGRRLCKVDELMFATAGSGIINSGAAASLWAFVGDGSGDSGYCRLNLSTANWFGRVYCDGGFPSLSDTGRICCQSR